MITHIALFRWKDGTTDEQVQWFADGLDEIVPQIDHVKGYRHGRNVGLTGDSWDYAVVADFEDEVGHRAYLDHPLHVDVSVNRGKPIAEASTRAQLRT